MIKTKWKSNILFHLFEDYRKFSLTCVDLVPGCLVELSTVLSHVWSITVILRSSNTYLHVQHILTFSHSFKGFFSLKIIIVRCVAISPSSKLTDFANEFFHFVSSIGIFFTGIQNTDLKKNTFFLNIYEVSIHYYCIKCEYLT